MAEAGDSEVAVLRAQGLVVACLTQAVFPQQGARLPQRPFRARDEDSRGKPAPDRGIPLRRTPSADPPPPIRIALGSAGELPPGSLYMTSSLSYGVIHAAVT